MSLEGRWGEVKVHTGNPHRTAETRSQEGEGTGSGITNFKRNTKEKTGSKEYINI